MNVISMSYSNRDRPLWKHLYDPYFRNAVLNTKRHLVFITTPNTYRIQKKKLAGAKYRVHVDNKSTLVYIMACAVQQQVITWTIWRKFARPYEVTRFEWVNP